MRLWEDLLPPAEQHFDPWSWLCARASYRPAVRVALVVRSCSGQSCSSSFERFLGVSFCRFSQLVRMDICMFIYVLELGLGVKLIQEKQLDACMFVVS